MPPFATQLNQLRVALPFTAKDWSLLTDAEKANYYGHVREGVHKGPRGLSRQVLESESLCPGVSRAPNLKIICRGGAFEGFLKASFLAFSIKFLSGSRSLWLLDSQGAT